MSVKCGNGTISIATIVNQCCRKPNKLQGWHVIEIKNVLPTNSSVKENQLVRIDLGLDVDSLDLESTRNMSVAHLKLLV